VITTFLYSKLSKYHRVEKNEKWLLLHINLHCTLYTVISTTIWVSTMSDMVKYRAMTFKKRPNSGPVFHLVWHSPSESSNVYNKTKQNAAWTKKMHFLDLVLGIHPTMPCKTKAWHLLVSTAKLAYLTKCQLQASCRIDMATTFTKQWFFFWPVWMQKLKTFWTTF
jgi:hypothetical protein